MHAFDDDSARCFGGDHAQQYRPLSVTAGRKAGVTSAVLGK